MQSVKINKSEVASTRDGILRVRCKHARGGNLADCGRICGSSRKSVGRNVPNDQQCGESQLDS